MKTARAVRREELYSLESECALKAVAVFKRLLKFIEEGGLRK